MYLLARGFLSLLGAGAGLALAQWLANRDVLSGPINLVYLTLVGFLIGYLVSPPIARRWVMALAKRVGARQTHSARRHPSGGHRRDGGAAHHRVAQQRAGVHPWLYLVFLAPYRTRARQRVLVVFRGEPSALCRAAVTPAPIHLFRTHTTRLQCSPLAKVVDTSAIIDGRIVDVAEANFIDSRLLIPHFVLGELQHIADSDDPLRRKRGRRGLDMLDRLVQGRSVSAEVVNDDFTDISEVDAKLVKLCLARGADLITTDFNLNRVAALQGVKVLNVNQLANAVKASYLPGELLALHIVRAGREPGQGLAYLEDGTMVVVEDSAHLVGNTVQTVVTSNLQTNMGRMIFARMQEDN